MCANYNSTEVFEIAEQMERNAVEFYTAAAEKFSDKGIREFMLSLAKIEKGHLRNFEQLKAQATDGSSGGAFFDPDNEIQYYLKAMATRAGWEGKAAPGVEFSGNESPTEVLKMAISAEQSSINYYIGLKEVLESDANKELLEKIIKEEMVHAAQLQKELERIA